MSFNLIPSKNTSPNITARLQGYTKPKRKKKLIFPNQMRAAHTKKAGKRANRNRAQLREIFRDSCSVLIKPEPTDEHTTPAHTHTPSNVHTDK